MTSSFNSGRGGFLVPPPPDSQEAPKQPEIARTDRELAEKISRHYDADLPNDRELVDSLETSIKNMDPEDRHSLERWVHEIDHHSTFLEPGRYMTEPDEKIIAQHMEQRTRAVNEVYELLLDRMTKELAKMKTADGKAVAVNTGAFRTLDADMPDRLRIENKVDAIEKRLSNEEKILTGREIGESMAFLQSVLERGIDTEQDQAGTTRARVQYLLTSVASLRSINKVAINRRRLLDMEGGQWLVENGLVKPDGGFVERVYRNGAEPIRDPVAMGARAVALVASSIYAVLAGIAFLNKKEKGPLDAAWVIVPGFIAAKMAGLLPKRLDEVDTIRTAENQLELSHLSPQFKNGILEPASMAQSVMDTESQKLYERMGGRNVAADAARDLGELLVDSGKRNALSRAMRGTITDEFLDEFAGADSPLSQSLKSLKKPEDRMRFLSTMENPLGSSQRLAWFAAVEAVLRT